MGTYLKAVDGPNISSPDYVGTFGSSQSNVILTLVEYVRKHNPNRELENHRTEEYRNTARVIYCAEWFRAIDTEAPKDPYEFRKYAIDRGVDWWLKVTEYEDEHVSNVREVIRKIAEYGQDVYET
jgi:hypothetical protein